MTNVLEELNEEQEIYINEQYKIWKKNAPYMYDLIISHALDWPSLTFQWLPTAPVLFDDYAQHSCLITSNANEKDNSALLIANIKIPLEKEFERQTRSNKKLDKDDQSDNILRNNAPKVEIATKITHQGEVNRARYCPLSPNLIATKTMSGDVHVFDTKQAGAEIPGKPTLKLIGHTNQGYGLAWNPREKSLVLSGAYDKRILLWDIEASHVDPQRIEHFSSFDYHTAPVQDVAWHKNYKNVFASCSDDRIIALWDTRFRHCEGRKPLFSIIAHTSEIYSLDFSPFNDYLFLSGSEDNTACLWDMRKLTRRLLSFGGHEGSVLKVQFSPFHSGIFASSGADRRVLIWDLSRCDASSNSPDNGLMFKHSGHRSKVADFDWNEYEKLVIGSVEENNLLQVWEMSKMLYYDNDDDTK